MYAVIDTETTGLSPKTRHRIAEIAVVLTDEKGNVESEWSTLVNPERDLGPQRIHGIRARDILDAPRFADVAGHVAALLTGRTIVAHNLPFDAMFLTAEFDRLGWPVPVLRECGVCTMAWSTAFLPGAGRNLEECCRTAGIPLHGWHCALTDAVATAGLLKQYISAAGRSRPWDDAVQMATRAVWPMVTPRPFAVRHRTDDGPVTAAGSTVVARAVDFLPRVDSTEAADPYLAVLDQALTDRYLSADEGAALRALADSLGLDDRQQASLHHGYLAALARVALSDGELSPSETADLGQVAAILGLPAETVDEVVGDARASNRFAKATELPIEAGDMVVFTGDMSEARELWIQRASEHGYVPHPNVTKKVKLVVAADPDSLSTKARKARGYGIPIMSIDAFREALGYPEPEHDGSHQNWSRGERSWAKRMR